MRNCINVRKNIGQKNTSPTHGRFHQLQPASVKSVVHSHRCGNVWRTSLSHWYYPSKHQRWLTRLLRLPGSLVKMLYINKWLHHTDSRNVAYVNRSSKVDCVCWIKTTSPAKKDEPVEVQIQGYTQVGPKPCIVWKGTDPCHRQGHFSHSQQMLLSNRVTKLRLLCSSILWLGHLTHRTCTATYP